MRHFLQNIAQSNPIRTTFLVLIGFSTWIISFINGLDAITILTTMVMTAINGMMLALVFYKTGKTKFLSSFVISSYWFAMSAISLLHCCWQAQMTAFCIFLISTIISNANNQNDVTEEVFLTTLLCCFLMPTRWIMIASIISLWAFFIIRGWITWRTCAATLIAISMRILLMIILHYFDYLSWIWIENIPPLSWQQWTIFFSCLIAAILGAMLPLRKPSIASGIIYIVILLLIATFSILFHAQIFQIPT